MVYKKVFFNCTAGSFIVSVVLGLKKVNNIIPKARLGANEKPLVSVSRSYSASRSSASSSYSSDSTVSKNSTYNSTSARVTYTSDNKPSNNIRASRNLTK